jgi:hypothetical protein
VLARDAIESRCLEDGSVAHKGACIGKAVTANGGNDLAVIFGNDNVTVSIQLIAQQSLFVIRFWIGLAVFVYVDLVTQAESRHAIGHAGGQSSNRTP